MIILITGGLGYIGSHIADSLLKNTNYQVIIIDVKKFDDIFGWEIYLNTRLFVYQHNLLSPAEELKTKLFKYNITSVIHCASLKSVPESVEDPLLYYDSNVGMTLNLLKWMKCVNIHRLIYSSSATLYGDTFETKFKETDITMPSNPYGNTKMVCEKILNDISQTNNKWRVVCLRYFNPAVSHFNVNQGNTNLFTAIEKIIQHNKNNTDKSYLTVNKVKQIDQTDGTCVRDYIHIDDLTDGHLKALEYISNTSNTTQFDIFNLGSENGYSTLDVAKNIERECEKVNIKFLYRIGGSRPGDAVILIANCEKAKAILGWTPKRDLNYICRDVVTKIANDK